MVALMLTMVATTNTDGSNLLMTMVTRAMGNSYKTPENRQGRSMEDRWRQYRQEKVGGLGRGRTEAREEPGRAGS